MLFNIEEFWADGSFASHQLSSRLKEKKEAEIQAYLNTWEGQREEEEKQRNAIASYLWSKEIGNELGK